MSNENNENNENPSAVNHNASTEVAAEPKEDFAKLLAQSTAHERLGPGQKVRAKVVSISGDFVYIDLGGKSEGVIDIAEFTDEGGTLSVHAGDEIDAFYVNVQDGVRRLT